MGSNYGRKIRKNLEMLGKTYKLPQKCPYCEKVSLKRAFKGVWICKKCNVQVVGGAFTPPTVRSLRKTDFRKK